MPSKLFIHIEPRMHQVGETPDFVELCRLPLEGAQSYLVQAKGLVGPEPGAIMTLKLDIFGFFEELLTSQQSVYTSNPQQFVLTAAATLPAEGGRRTTLPAEGGRGTTLPLLGASANLSVKAGWITPPDEPLVGVSVTDVILIALSVDEIVLA